MAQELASCKRADGSLRSHWLNYLHGGNVSNVRVNFADVETVVRVASDADKTTEHIKILVYFIIDTCRISCSETMVKTHLINPTIYDVTFHQ